jgi:peptidoglycan/LPS O-acetylase OafA/YrhL
VLVLRQRRVAEPEPPADRGLSLVRGLSAAGGVLLLVGAAALYLAPIEVGEHWPWALTPLLARAVAAWYAMVGTMLVSCAWQLRRSTEAVIPYGTLAAWCLLLLALPVLHSDDVDTGGGAFVAWLVVMVALLALAVLALARSLPRVRDQGL